MPIKDYIISTTKICTVNVLRSPAPMKYINLYNLRANIISHWYEETATEDMKTTTKRKTTNKRKNHLY